MFDERYIGVFGTSSRKKFSIPFVAVSGGRKQWPQNGEDILSLHLYSWTLSHGKAGDSEGHAGCLEFFFTNFAKNVGSPIVF